MFVGYLLLAYAAALAIFHLAARLAEHAATGAVLRSPVRAGTGAVPPAPAGRSAAPSGVVSARIPSRPALICRSERVPSPGSMESGSSNAETVLFGFAELGIGAGELAHGEIDQALVGAAALSNARSSRSR